MLDQSFSADNFRKIFDIENRKGNYLEGEFFPDIEKKSQKIQSCIADLRSLRKQKALYSPEDFENLRSELSSKLEQLRQNRYEMLINQLEEVSERVCAKDFKFGIEEVDVGKPKKAFVAERNAATFFALKQIQYNVSRLYKVKQANRHQIICQLRELLGDRLPKYIIRTDISSFYESIPRNQLLKKLKDDPLLTLLSKKIIRRILFEYHEKTGNDIGLPRGIGLSAYLAELYMRDIDGLVRDYPGVLYYARYVDDIVIIYCPPPNTGTRAFRKLVAQAFKRLGLKRNRKKSQFFAYKPDLSFQFEYLGYKFNIGSNSVELQMSDKKIDRYKQRLDLSFADYQKKAKTAEKKARILLEKRVRFLTGNTRLVNNKKNVVSGIYFSNSLLENTQDLDQLDLHLQSKIATIASGRLKNRLSNCSFKYGFQTRKYHKFSAQNLSEIVEVWKHVS